MYLFSLCNQLVNFGDWYFVTVWITVLILPNDFSIHRWSICALSCPFPSSIFSFLFLGRVFCLFEDRYSWAKSLIDDESSFHPVYISTCVSVRKQMGKDNRDEVTHAFGGKYLPEVDLVSASVFIFLSITISWKMVIPHPCTFNYHLCLWFL